MALADGLRPDAGIPYLRPSQLREMKMEEQRLTSDLQNPGISDKDQVRQSLGRLRQQRSRQSPPEMTPGEQDRAAKLETQLRTEMLDGMPTHAEMENAPPGAVSKHQMWEDRKSGELKIQNRHKIQLWKNLRILLDPQNESPDLANFEQFRPGGAQLNMDNAYISRKSYQPTTRPPGTIEGLGDRIRWDMVFGDAKTKKRADSAFTAFQYAAGFDRTKQPSKEQLAALEEFLADARPDEQEVELPSEKERAAQPAFVAVDDLVEPKKPEEHVLQDL
jgi:hypothetical protein